MSTILFCIQIPKMVYFVYCCLLPILSIYYQQDFFICFMMFDIIVNLVDKNQSESLKNVIRAITYNGDKLALAFVLLCIMVFLFSQFGFFFLLDDWYLPSIYPRGEDQCSTSGQCFLFVLALGPRSSGGIADMMKRQSYQSENRSKYFVQWAYGIIGFIVINLLGLNILFGIILDTFKELRANRQMVEEDQKTVCFICGIKNEWVVWLHKVRPTRQRISQSHQV
jgi:hypothetical protein